VQNQLLATKLFETDYRDKLAHQPTYKTLRQAQKNIK
jgi:hypothetical protein